MPRALHIAVWAIVVLACLRVASAAEQPSEESPGRKFSDLLRTLRERQKPKPPAPERPAPPAKLKPGRPAPEASAPADTAEPGPPAPPSDATTSDDPTYGYSKKNPIPIPRPAGQDMALARVLAGIRAEQAYLQRLRDPQGRPLELRRVGTLIGPSGHPLDQYEVDPAAGRPRTLFLDIYPTATDLPPPKAPRGFRLAPSAPPNP